MTVLLIVMSLMILAATMYFNFAWRRKNHRFRANLNRRAHLVPGRRILVIVEADRSGRVPAVFSKAFCPLRVHLLLLLHRGVAAPTVRFLLRDEHVHRVRLPSAWPGFGPAISWAAMLQNPPAIADKCDFWLLAHPGLELVEHWDDLLLAETRVAHRAGHHLLSAPEPTRLPSVLNHACFAGARDLVRGLLLRAPPVPFLSAAQQNLYLTAVAWLLGLRVHVAEPFYSNARTIAATAPLVVPRWAKIHDAIFAFVCTGDASRLAQCEQVPAVQFLRAHARRNEHVVRQLSVQIREELHRLGLE